MKHSEVDIKTHCIPFGGKSKGPGGLLVQIWIWARSHAPLQASRALHPATQLSCAYQVPVTSTSTQGESQQSAISVREKEAVACVQGRRPHDPGHMAARGARPPAGQHPPTYGILGALVVRSGLDGAKHAHHLARVGIHLEQARQRRECGGEAPVGRQPPCCPIPPLVTQGRSPSRASPPPSPSPLKMSPRDLQDPLPGSTFQAPCPVLHRVAPC